MNGIDEADNLLAKEISENKKKQKALGARAKKARKRVKELEAIPAVGIFELSDYERELEKAKSESKKTDVSKDYKKRKGKKKGDIVKHRKKRGISFKQFTKFRKQMGRRIPNKAKKRSSANK